jgi:hypothetical protein
MRVTRLIAAAVACAAAPWAMAQSAAPESGVLVTHTNSQQWEVRLISGGQAEQFSGIFESDQPITAVRALSLQSKTSAQLLTSNSLGTTLSAGDSASFTIGRDASLCLRDTGSSSVHIYLGDSLADAIPVTAPVALTSADACGVGADSISLSADSASLSGASTSVTAPLLGRKFHPGHWIVLGRGADTQSIMADAARPGVVGLVKRYTWRSLETAQGRYNFAELKSDLAWCAARGLHFIMIIEDKTFTLEKPGPAYLDKFDVRNRAGGYTMIRWNATVVQRFNALTKAIGTQFDKTASFEGIATQESSLGLESPTLNAFGYSATKYRDALINILGTAATNMPSSRVFWLMNFLVGGQQYIGNIAAAVSKKGVVMGGPDVWPDNRSLQSKVYPFYTQFYGKMPLFGQVENVCYSEPHMTSGYRTKYWTMKELFGYAKQHMHVNYMFWVRVTKPSPKDAYDWLDALPVINGTRSWSP